MQLGTTYIRDPDIFMQMLFRHKLVRLSITKGKLIIFRWFVSFGWSRNGLFLFRYHNFRHFGEPLPPLTNESNEVKKPPTPGLSRSDAF